MRIDGHAHLWKPGEGFDILPIRANAAFAGRDWLPEHLRPELERLGIERIVITQSAPQIAETLSMLAHCRDLDFVAGVVGWADLAAANVVSDISVLSADPKFLGLRLQLRRMPDDDYIARANVRAGLDELVRRDRVAVLLAEQRHHNTCLSTLRELSTGRFILNHGGMPDIAHGDLTLWARTMRRYAAETDVVTQLSGLVALAGEGWTMEMIRPVAHTLFDIFGPSRIMFCSDWPLSTLYGVDYDRWWNIVQGLLVEIGLSTAERDDVLGGVAARTYRIS